MPSTITEKILARAGGRERVEAGENLPFRPDHMIAYDFPGYTDVMFRQMRDDFGIERLDEPERYVVFIDHMLTRGDAREEEVHGVTRDWCRYYGIDLQEGHAHLQRDVGFDVVQLKYELVNALDDVRLALPGGPSLPPRMTIGLVRELRFRLR